jgi:hypothetical protein
MANPTWAPAIWAPTPWPPFPLDPLPPEPSVAYDPWAPAVFQTADWTCACASSAWLLNSVGDARLGRAWNEWDVVDALRAATYPGAVSPEYGLARADMYDLEVMFGVLGYSAERQQYLSVDDLVPIAGSYPLQINGARWYHHSGARALGPGVLYLANPAPTWKGVGQEMNANEAANWGSWNGLWIIGET